jgi:hypothetical protein
MTGLHGHHNVRVRETVQAFVLAYATHRKVGVLRIVRREGLYVHAGYGRKQSSLLLVGCAKGRVRVIDDLVVSEDVGLGSIDLRSVVCTMRSHLEPRTLHFEDTFRLGTLVHGDKFFGEARRALEVSVHVRFIFLSSLNEAFESLRHFYVICHAWGPCYSDGLIGLVLFTETSFMHWRSQREFIERRRDQRRHRREKAMFSKGQTHVARVVVEMLSGFTTNLL